MVEIRVSDISEVARAKIELYNYCVDELQYYLPSYELTCY